MHSSLTHRSAVPSLKALLSALLVAFMFMATLAIANVATSATPDTESSWCPAMYCKLYTVGGGGGKSNFR